MGKTGLHVRFRSLCHAVLEEKQGLPDQVILKRPVVVTEKLIGDMNSFSRFSFLFSLAALLSPCMAEAQSVTGAGSSFAAPLYESWGVLAQEKGNISVNYQSVGSGAGLNQVVAGTVDFGASDKPAAKTLLSDHQLYQFPTTLGAIVVIVNLPDMPAGALRLDGPTLAAIYDGRISEWNDQRIQAQNPGVSLPDIDVAPIHRRMLQGQASCLPPIFLMSLRNGGQGWGQGLLLPGPKVPVRVAMTELLPAYVKQSAVSAMWNMPMPVTIIFLWLN